MTWQIALLSGNWPFIVHTQWRHVSSWMSKVITTWSSITTPEWGLIQRRSQGCQFCGKIVQWDALVPLIRISKNNTKLYVVVSELVFGVPWMRGGSWVQCFMQMQLSLRAMKGRCCRRVRTSTLRCFCSFSIAAVGRMGTVSTHAVIAHSKKAVPRHSCQMTSQKHLVSYNSYCMHCCRRRLYN
jgi:hypothetical protein